MTNGRVEGIYISPNRGEPTIFVEHVHVVPGMGIEGDRYFKPPGTTEARSKPGCELTLIEIEAIEAICKEDGIQITPDKTRRNIVTRGVSLNELVGSVFTIGNIQLRGVRLCEPCNYLANQTDPRILNSMAHRGGLRAEIISEGIIHIKDVITISELGAYMSDLRASAIQYAHENAIHFLDGLKEFASIPSISTDEVSKKDLLRAADWVANHLRSLGMANVQIFPTAGHPVVFGEWLEAGNNAPTALIYGHYDVQPVDPLNLWITGPFNPDIRGDYIYARGSTDMKGQMLVALDAIESISKTGRLPINFKFVFEGEEEIGSPNLAPFLETHKDLLKCDIAINPDTGTLTPDIPCITYALRGLAYLEIRVYGPDHDLHSGVFGGAVLNPAQALCELIAGMHDAEGRVTLPGFYEKVRPIEPEEKAELARLPIGDEYYLAATGVPALYGEAGFTTIERLGVRPTLEVNGLLSGFTGEGAKTVLPAWAMAKISTRLVPDQQPTDVYQLMQSYLEAHAPKEIRWSLTPMHGGPASISDRNSKYIKALSRALETVWHKKPVFKREGGSVPVVSDFQQILGVETVNTGFSMPDDNMHSPNEKLHLPTWYRGIDTFIHFYFNLAQ